MKPKTGSAAEEIRKFIGYLKNNEECTNYDKARKGGYPLGSGGIEEGAALIFKVP